MAIKIVLEQEIIVRGNTAKVLIYDDEKLVKEVTASVELQPGADGGHYHAVKLIEK